MKLKNILFSLIMLVSMLFIGTANAETTAPSSFNVRGSDLHVIDGTKYLSGVVGLNVQYKKNTDGKIIYCIERTKNMISTRGTETYTLDKEMDKKIAYIMQNGYPNKRFSNDEDKDYYATALSIWYVLETDPTLFRHFDLNNGTYRGTSNDVVKIMAQLINGANSYSYTNPSIKINNSNSKLTLSSDRNYYVSSSMSVKTTGNIANYTVSLNNAPEGTIVTDTKGNAKTTFATNESFLVKVPVSNVKKISNEFEVNVSAKGTINKAYAYTSTRSNVQNTGALYPENSNVNDSTTVKLNVVTVVEISKVDVTTGEELAGAHLELKDEKGNLIEAWVSTNESHVIEGLAPGKYTLTEVIAPDGYELSKETVTFVVKEDGTVDGKVIMYNTPETIEVPSTGTFKTITTSLIGLLIIGLGSVIVYRNYKKNEEN